MPVRCAGSYVLLVSLLIFFHHGEGARTLAKNASDSCFEDRRGTFPCSSTVTGNLILMVFYAALLAAAAKFISDGAEMLLDFGLSPSVIGGVVLPVLGAVPDCAIIVASGLGDDAQEKLSVGMGTLAGSTVMLLTIAWAASVIIGRCDLDSNGEAEDGKCEGTLSLTEQGVTVLPDVRPSIYFMLMTSLSYLIVQSADWHWGATLKVGQPAYVKNAALATLVVCIIGLIFYVGFSVFNSIKNERMTRLHKQELLKRKVLHTLMMSLSANKSLDVNTEENQSSDMDIMSKKYFAAWKVTAGSKILRGKVSDNSFDSQTSVRPEESGEASNTQTTKLDIIKCISLLVGGVAIVTIFSDPMCDVLTALTNKSNVSFIPIPTFYVSFVITPFCSNASELVASLIFASKKTKENITMTVSQLLGAATMNNTLCLAIFMALVYFKDLEWIYGAEVVCILLVQWVVGGISWVHSYKLWMGIPVGVTYLLCIFLVWLLENKAGWH